MPTLVLSDDDAIYPHVDGLAIDDHIIFMLDPKHPDFKQNVKRACRHGFRHPLMSTKLINQTMKTKTPYLFLYHKYNDEYGKQVDQEKYEQFKKQVKFCLKTYQQHQKNHMCSIHITISEDAINYLHDYSKTYRFTTDKGHEQREISGRFLLYETVKNMFHVTVDKESVNLGEKEETSSSDTLASFHTHPLDAYHRYKVCMAWPSVDDYSVFLGIYANGYGMFHILGTVEGMYIITISSRLAKEGREKIKKNLAYYDKQIREYYHVNYPTCSIHEDNETNEEVWLKKIKRYLGIMNAKKYFNVQFVLWKDANRPIQIDYKDIEQNCMISDEQIKFNKFLSKPIDTLHKKA
jgi:hypothetical protein